MQNSGAGFVRKRLKNLRPKIQSEVLELHFLNSLTVSEVVYIVLMVVLWIKEFLAEITAFYHLKFTFGCEYYSPLLSS